MEQPPPPEHWTQSTACICDRAKPRTMTLWHDNKSQEQRDSWERFIWRSPVPIYNQHQSNRKVPQGRALPLVPLPNHPPSSPNLTSFQLAAINMCHTISYTHPQCGHWKSSGSTVFPCEAGYDPYSWCQAGRYTWQRETLVAPALCDRCCQKGVVEAVKLFKDENEKEGEVKDISDVKTGWKERFLVWDPKKSRSLGYRKEHDTLKSDSAELWPLMFLRGCLVNLFMAIWFMNSVDAMFWFLLTFGVFAQCRYGDGLVLESTPLGRYKTWLHQPELRLIVFALIWHYRPNELKLSAVAVPGRPVHYANECCTAMATASVRHRRNNKGSLDFRIKASFWPWVRRWALDHYGTKNSSHSFLYWPYQRSAVAAPVLDQTSTDECCLIFRRSHIAPR